MIRRLAFVALVASCQPAPAAVLETWSGAGPNACYGRCSLDWAETQLTADELAELRIAQEQDPRLVLIDDGSVFTLMSYFKDGAPVAYRTWTVAVVGDFETAEGWVMDGWSFVRLNACDNWAIVKHGERFVVDVEPPWTPPETVWTPPEIVWTPPDDPRTPWTPPDTPWIPVYPPETPVDVPTVPVPPSIMMMLAAVGALVMRRRKSC